MAFVNMKTKELVFGYIAGLGGRDVTPETLKEIYYMTKEKDHPETESVWIGLNP